MVPAESAAKAVVRDFIARLNERADVWAFLSEQAVVTINGTTPLSGRYPGGELIRGILADSAQLAIATLEVEIRELIGAGSRIAALLCMSGKTPAGAAFNAERRLCGCAFTVRDGRIEEVTLFPDTSLIEIALYGRRYEADV